MNPVGVPAPFEVDGYALYTRTVTLKGNREQTVYFFSRGAPKAGTPCASLPEGYEVGKNPRNGVPVVRKAGREPRAESAPKEKKAKLHPWDKWNHERRAALARDMTKDHPLDAEEVAQTLYAALPPEHQRYIDEFIAKEKERRAQKGAGKGKKNAPAPAAASPADDAWDGRTYAQELEHRGLADGSERLRPPPEEGTDDEAEPGDDDVAPQDDGDVVCACGHPAARHDDDARPDHNLGCLVDMPAEGEDRGSCPCPLSEAAVKTPPAPRDGLSDAQRSGMVAINGFADMARGDEQVRAALADPATKPEVLDDGEWRPLADLVDEHAREFSITGVVDANGCVRVRKGMTGDGHPVLAVNLLAWLMREPAAPARPDDEAPSILPDYGAALADFETFLTSAMADHELVAIMETGNAAAPMIETPLGDGRRWQPLIGIIRSLAGGEPEVALDALLGTDGRVGVRRGPLGPAQRVPVGELADWIKRAPAVKQEPIVYLGSEPYPGLQAARRAGMVPQDVEVMDGAETFHKLPDLVKALGEGKAPPSGVDDVDGTVVIRVRDGPECRVTWSSLALLAEEDEWRRLLRGEPTKRQAVLDVGVPRQGQRTLDMDLPAVEVKEKDVRAWTLGTTNFVIKNIPEDTVRQIQQERDTKTREAIADEWIETRPTCRFLPSGEYEVNRAALLARIDRIRLPRRE